VYECMSDECMSVAEQFDVIQWIVSHTVITRNFVCSNYNIIAIYHITHHETKLTPFLESYAVCLFLTRIAI